MDVNALAVFVKVVQTGSFTRAAAAMGTQKARLSRVVAQLERAIGILGAVDDVERVAQRMHAEPRGVLKLTCGVEFGMIAVSRWIDTYLRRYPQVSIGADFTSRIIDIVHEGFDLAIRVGELPDSRLAARRIGELQYGLFASAAYVARRAGVSCGHSATRPAHVHCRQSRFGLATQPWARAASSRCAREAQDQ
jgi:DNA-binding transcriptional LysR family regulator